ncbi:unnamed protein product [Onchocerca flexuosa]|uniref:ATP synthase subunit e, mitochondrial n=1 Tax=Onchocerca flexuosa TaxID=387005 RepID=A0A183HXC0_9BILA|nr:unnamed protein product [Onchocerca flexuosa]
MPSLSRLSAVTLSAIVGGAYYLRSEKWPFGSEKDAVRSMSVLKTAECAVNSTSLQFPDIHPSPQTKWDSNWDNVEFLNRNAF